MNKAHVLQAILDALREEFDTFQTSSRETRSAGNDEESKSEGKYDTRSIEENYLADGLARQAQNVAAAAKAYEGFTAPPFTADDPIDLGALVKMEFPGDSGEWFFLGPAGGGVKVACGGMEVTVITPDSPLGSQLLGLKTGAVTRPSGAVVREVR